MGPDYRSEPMPSSEGEGRARRAWNAYARTVNRAALPLTRPLAKRLALSWTEDLTGFWVLWHLHGGFEGLEKLGFPRSTIYRKIKRFRTAFGEHPDTFEFPGVHLNVEEYVADGIKRAERKRQGTKKTAKVKR